MQLLVGPFTFIEGHRWSDIAGLWGFQLDHGYLRKMGVNTQGMDHICRFSKDVDNCELKDLGYNGPKYTWGATTGEVAQICERLDMFLANSQWASFFSKDSVNYGTTAYSDHLPLWFDIEGNGTHMRKKRAFRFEAMWIGGKEC